MPDGPKITSKNYAHTQRKECEDYRLDMASCARENPSDWIAKMHSYGVSGAKIDFFERNDQIAMRWGKEFAERLAEKQMVAIFHGCPSLPDCIARIPIY